MELSREDYINLLKSLDIESCKSIIMAYCEDFNKDPCLTETLWNNIIVHDISPFLLDAMNYFDRKFKVIKVCKALKDIKLAITVI